MRRGFRVGVFIAFALSIGLGLHFYFAPVHAAGSEDALQKKLEEVAYFFEGRVVDPDGKPVEGAEVWGFGGMVLTDKKGRFEGWNPKEYFGEGFRTPTLKAVKEGFKFGRVELSTDQSEYVVSLRHLHSLNIKLEGLPKNHAFIEEPIEIILKYKKLVANHDTRMELDDELATTLRLLRPTNDYQLEEVIGGEATLQVRMDDFVSRPLEVVIHGETNLTVPLKPSGSIRVEFEFPSNSKQDSMIRVNLKLLPEDKHALPHEVFHAHLIKGEALEIPDIESGLYRVEIDNAIVSYERYPWNLSKHHRYRKLAPFVFKAPQNVGVTKGKEVTLNVKVDPVHVLKVKPDDTLPANHIRFQVKDKAGKVLPLQASYSFIEFPWRYFGLTDDCESLVFEREGYETNEIKLAPLVEAGQDSLVVQAKPLNGNLVIQAIDETGKVVPSFVAGLAHCRVASYASNKHGVIEAPLSEKDGALLYFVSKGLAGHELRAVSDVTTPDGKAVTHRVTLKKAVTIDLAHDGLDYGYYRLQYRNDEDEWTPHKFYCAQVEPGSVRLFCFQSKVFEKPREVGVDTRWGESDILDERRLYSLAKGVLQNGQHLDLNVTMKPVCWVSGGLGKHLPQYVNSAESTFFLLDSDDKKRSKSWKTRFRSDGWSELVPFALHETFEIRAHWNSARGHSESFMVTIAPPYTVRGKSSEDFHTSLRGFTPIEFYSLIEGLPAQELSVLGRLDRKSADGSILSPVSYCIDTNPLTNGVRLLLHGDQEYEFSASGFYSKDRSDTLTRNSYLFGEIRRFIDRNTHRVIEKFASPQLEGVISFEGKGRKPKKDSVRVQVSNSCVSQLEEIDSAMWRYIGETSCSAKGVFSVVVATDYYHSVVAFADGWASEPLVCKPGQKDPIKVTLKPAASVKLKLVNRIMGAPNEVGSRMTIYPHLSEEEYGKYGHNYRIRTHRLDLKSKGSSTLSGAFPFGSYWIQFDCAPYQDIDLGYDTFSFQRYALVEPGTSSDWIPVVVKGKKSTTVEAEIVALGGVIAFVKPGGSGPEDFKLYARNQKEGAEILNCVTLEYGGPFRGVTGLVAGKYDFHIKAEGYRDFWIKNKKLGEGEILMLPFTMQKE